MENQFIYSLVEYHQNGYWEPDVMVNVGQVVYTDEQTAWDEANRRNSTRTNAWQNFWKAQKHFVCR